jgi:hypothetical protein
VVNAVARSSASQEQLLVVFVHGWKHSAQAGDGNIDTNRKGLRGLSELETGATRRPRPLRDQR